MAAGGCFFCVSRTFSVDGSEPTAAQRDVYRAAHEWLLGMESLVRPGVTCGELAVRAPAVPERYRAQRYECMIHGIGLEEENPSVCDPRDVQPNPDTVLEEGMVLVVELYAGEVGAADGVKLGDQVVVTAEGCRVLVRYPFCERLLT